MHGGPASHLARGRFLLLAVLALGGILGGGGAVGATAFAVLALLGLGLTLLLARGERTLLAGAAATDAALSLLACGLLVSAHPFFAGRDLASLWLPVFGPLAFLGALESLGTTPRLDLGREVGLLRAIAASLASVALFAHGVPVLAGVALWTAVSALLVHRGRGAARVRRAVAFLSLVAALVALALPPLAPLLPDASVSGAGTAVGAVLWEVASALLLGSALPDLLEPKEEAAAPPLA